MNYWIVASIFSSALSGFLFGMVYSRDMFRTDATLFCVYAACLAGSAAYVFWFIKILVIGGFWWQFWADGSYGYQPPIAHIPQLGHVALGTAVMCGVTLVGPFLATHELAKYWFKTRGLYDITPRFNQSSRNE